MAEKFRTEPMLAARSYGCIALKSNGTVWSWGADWSLDGGIDQRFSLNPIQVKISDGSYLTSVKKVKSGNLVHAAIKEDGTLWMWGHNKYGQCGTGSATESAVVNATQVRGVNGIGYLQNVRDISMYQQHVIAVLEDGTVYGWGNGGVAFGISGNIATPIQLGAGHLNNVKNLSTFGSTSLALCEDGTIYAWGSCTYSGTGLTQGTIAPSQARKVIDENNVPLSSIKFINSTFAVKEDGHIYSWGLLRNGRTGSGREGVKLDKAVYVLDSNQNEIVGDYLLTGSESIFAWNNTDVYCWGQNDYGQLGMGDDHLIYAERNPNLNSILLMSSHNTSSNLAKTDGTVWTMGLHSLGYHENTDIPTQIFYENGEPFLLFEDDESIDPPNPGPDPGPKPGEDCCNCCGCCCRPIIIKDSVVNFYCNGHCHIECEESENK